MEDAPKAGRIMGFIKGTTVNDFDVSGRDMLQKALAYDEAQLERDGILQRA
jgi:hypothetical protein